MTTYQEPLGRHLVARDEERVRLVDVRQDAKDLAETSHLLFLAGDLARAAKLSLTQVPPERWPSS